MWGSRGIIILCGNSKRNQGAATLRLTPTNTSWLTTYLALCQSAISRFTMFHYVSLLLTVNSLDWCWMVFTIVCSSRTHEIPHLSVSIQCNPSSMRCLASAIYQHSQIPLPNIYIYIHTYIYLWANLAFLLQGWVFKTSKLMQRTRWILWFMVEYGRYIYINKEDLMLGKQ